MAVYDAGLSRFHSLPAGVTLRSLAKALLDDRTGLHRSWPAMPERWPRVSMRSTRRSGPTARASTLRPVRQSRSRFTCYSSAPKPTRRLTCER